MLPFILLEAEGSRNSFSPRIFSRGKLKNLVKTESVTSFSIEMEYLFWVVVGFMVLIYQNEN